MIIMMMRSDQLEIIFGGPKGSDLWSTLLLVHLKSRRQFSKFLMTFICCDAN